MSIQTSRGLSPSRCKAMEAIVAVYSDWGIGSGGTQPVVLKADRTHFKELTDGAAVIVGRKTLGDFPGGRPLKGRHNIVVTRQDIEVAGAQVAHSTGEALTLAAEYERGVFSCLSKEAYIDLLCSCIDHLNPAIVLHRVTGDGPKDLLIAPIWSLQKRDVLNSLHKALKAGGHYQGRDFGNHRPL